MLTEVTVYYIKCEGRVYGLSLSFDETAAYRDTLYAEAGSDLSMCQEPHAVRSKVVAL